MTSHRAAWSRPLSALLASLLLASLVGCAFGEWRPNDPMRRRYSLELVQHDYTQLIRWGEFERAISFVRPEAREEFLKSLPKVHDLRFTDSETGSIELSDDMKSATVEVTYSAYRLSSPVEVQIHETQKWSRESGNDWKVEPSFAGLEQLLSARGGR